MAIKNPFVLKAAINIYSYFLSKNKNLNEAKIFNMLEIAESDEKILNKINKETENNNRYQNIEARLNLIKEEFENESYK